MSDTKYNGWTNYETWDVKLWIDNDEGSYRYWQIVARKTFEAALEENSRKLSIKRHQTVSEQARYMLARKLENEIKEGVPDLGASMYSDLLGAALSEVNWYEIASALLENGECEAEGDDGEVVKYEAE